MKKKSLRYIIGIVVLMLFSVLALSGCKKKFEKEPVTEKEQTTTDTEDKLQLEEDDEGEQGDSVDFEDVFLNESEENKPNVNKDNAVQENNKNNNKEEGKQKDNKEEDKEEVKQEDNKEDDQEEVKQEDSKEEDKEEVKQEDSKEEDKEEVKQEDNKEDDQENMTGVGANKEEGWGAFY